MSSANDKQKNKTIRIEVELEKTGDDSFPEFSYVALVDELTKQSDTKSLVIDEKDLALSAYFESKYGNFGNTATFDNNKRKRRERIEDLMDMGEGYDVNDDFIDDSDAHDIFVPQEYDTWHGGFYVNQGKLRFKLGDESEDVNLITGTKKRNLGIKILKDDEELSESKSDDETVRNPKQPDLITQKIVAKAKKTQKVIAEKVNEVLASETDDEELNASDTSLANEVSEEKVAKIKIDETNIEPKIEQKPHSPKATTRLIHEKQDVKIVTQPNECDLLPADIQYELRDKCENMRKIAELQNGLSSQKFFSPLVNHLLFEIEQMVQNLPQKTRSCIYNYLVKPMPCTKDTFICRLKKMKKESCEIRLSEPHSRLVIYIAGQITEQEKRYQQQKDLHEIKLAEYNEKSRADATSKKPRNPTKSFTWNAEARSRFHELILTKKELYGIIRPRGVTCDEWVSKYIEDEVKGIWPSGWITLKHLEKMAKNVIQSSQPQPPVNTSNSVITANVLPISSSSTIVAPDNLETKEKCDKVGQKRKFSDDSSKVANTQIVGKRKKERVIAESANVNTNMMKLFMNSIMVNSQYNSANNAAVLQEIAKKLDYTKPNCVKKAIVKKGKKLQNEISNSDNIHYCPAKSEKQQNSINQSNSVNAVKNISNNSSLVNKDDWSNNKNYNTTKKAINNENFTNNGRPESPDLVIMSVTQPTVSSTKMTKNGEKQTSKAGNKCATVSANSYKKIVSNGQNISAARKTIPNFTNHVPSVKTTGALDITNLCDSEQPLTVNIPGGLPCQFLSQPSLNITSIPTSSCVVPIASVSSQSCIDHTMINRANFNSHTNIPNDSQLAGGLSFTQICPTTVQSTNQSVFIQPINSIINKQNALNSWNDLSFIKPTLSFNNQTTAFLNEQHQLQYLRQQQAEQNMNVQ